MRIPFLLMPGCTTFIALYTTCWRNTSSDSYEDLKSPFTFHGQFVGAVTRPQINNAINPNRLLVKCAEWTIFLDQIFIGVTSRVLAVSEHCDNLG